MSRDPNLTTFRLYEDARRRKAEAEAALDKVKAELANLEEAVLVEFEMTGQSKVFVDGRTYFPRRDVRASAKNGDTEYLASVLRELGLSDIVKETVNANTLSAYVREQIGDDRDPDVLPPTLRDALDLTIGYRVGNQASKRG
jgi:hypothetical protein